MINQRRILISRDSDVTRFYLTEFYFETPSNDLMCAAQSVANVTLTCICTLTWQQLCNHLIFVLVFVKNVQKQ